MSEMSSHILVVDDHKEIRESVTCFLEKNGLRATAAKDAHEMDVKLASDRFDLLILDVMMPGESGLSVCQRLAGQHKMPIIMLTALDEDTDRIVGLEIGAADYLSKPFNPRELLARIRAVLRRTGASQGQLPDFAGKKLRFADFTLDTEKHALLDRDGRETPLTNTDYKLLTVFLQHERVVLSRDQLLNLTESRPSGPLDRTIDNQISRLRRKIERDILQPQIITTVRNGGYCLATDVEVIED